MSIGPEPTPRELYEFERLKEAQERAAGAPSEQEVQAMEMLARMELGRANGIKQTVNEQTGAIRHHRKRRKKRQQAKHARKRNR